MPVRVDLVEVPLVIGLCVEAIPDAARTVPKDKMLLIEEGRDEYPANRRMPMGVDLEKVPAAVVSSVRGIPDLSGAVRVDKMLLIR